jgi:hypothetical protein
MNRALMDEQEWEYNESLRINQEKEEQFLREAFAIPAKEPTAKHIENTEDSKEETKEEAKLTLSELRKARLQFYEKKIDLKKES